jgi:hypothetical protein
VWDWPALLTLREAGAWFAGGTGVRDLEIVRQFHDAGIPPDLAGRGVLRLGRQTGWTFLQMMRAGRMTVHDVRTIISPSHPRREANIQPTPVPGMGSNYYPGEPSARLTGSDKPSNLGRFRRTSSPVRWGCR